MDESLTRGPIRKHLLRMAIPMSIGMFFNTMFNVTDTFFAGKLGTQALAGMSVSFSVFFILSAFVSGIATGVAALLSNALGREDNSQVEQFTINGLFLTLAVSLLLSVVGFLFSPFLLVILGAEGEALAAGTRYVRTIYAGTVFFGLNATLNAFLSARGWTKPYRNFLIVGFLANLVLDPLLIFGWLGLPRLGTIGVALATVVVQMVGNVYLAYKVRCLLGLRVTRETWKLINLTRQLEILAQGIPSALNMLTVAVGVFVINLFIYRFGNDASTAGYGAAMRLEQLALMPALGLNAATLTLTGQNYGAGRLDRVRETFFTALKIGLAIMTVGMVLIYPFAPFFIGLFNDDPRVIAEGTRYLRIEFIAFNAYILINVCLSVLQGLKKPRYAVWIGIYRQVAMPLLLFNFLGITMGLGLVGVWWGIVITTWTGALGMLLLTRYEYRRIVRLDSAADSTH
ncbi:MAG: MATE family efflux transporter [Clostridiaceae bacterium]|nr:MATE family efflux transporter [Clostridiaceae bacterium]